MKKQFFLIALRNICRHWKKSLITGICLALGFTGVLLLGGYMIRMEKYLTTQGIYLNHVGHLSIYKKDGLERHLVEPEHYSFTLSDQQKILESLSSKIEIDHVAKFIHGQGMMTNGCQNFPFIAWGAEQKIESYVRNHPLVQKRIPLLTRISKGHGFWEENQFSSDIMVTKRLAELLQKPLTLGDVEEKPDAQGILIENCEDKKSNDLIRSHSGIQLIGNSFSSGMALADSNIVGHFSTGFALSEDSSAMMPLTFAQSFFKTDHITSFGIYLKDESKTLPMMKWLKSELPNLKIDFDIYPYFDYRVNPFYVGAMRFVYIMNLFFFIIVCGVVVLSLINAIQIAILERKTEIGTLFSIGYRKSQVRQMFEIESLILALISLFVGLLLSLLITTIVNSMGIQFDIVGNAEKLFLILELDWRFCIILLLFFIFLVYVSTSLICRKYLNVPLTKLLERID